MELNKNLTSIEKTFNVAGSIPVVAIFSGLLRSLAAKVQMIAGALIGLIGLIGQLFSDLAKWENIAHKGLEQFIHGGLNFVRSLGEILLGLTVIGSIGLLIYQSLSKNKFEPIYKYDESAAPAVVQ